MREPFYSENDWKRDDREMDRLQQLEDLEMRQDGKEVEEKKIWVKVRMLKNYGMLDEGPVYEKGQVVEIVDFLAEGWMKRGICEQVS